MDFSDAKKNSRAASVLFTLLIVFTLTGYFFGELRLLQKDGMLLLPEWLWKLAALLAVPLCALACSSRYGLFPAARRRCLPPSLTDLDIKLIPELFSCGLALLLISGYMKKNFGFYACGFPFVTSPLSVVALGAVACALVLPLARRSQDKAFSILFSPVVLLLCQCAITAAFLHYASGQILISDDHPSFLYRLQQLNANFPFIPFYDPAWNAGSLAYDSLSTGALNVFFLCWPLLTLWGDFNSPETARVYTLLIPYLFVFILPWSNYFAARLLGFCRCSGVAAGLLALGPSLIFFEWLLQYGTMGFAVSTSLAPLAIALCFKVACDAEAPRWRDVAAAAVGSSLCLFWMLSFLFFAPLALFALLRWRDTLAADRRSKVAGLILLVALFNGPWAYKYSQAVNVGGLLSRTTLPGAAAESGKSTKPRLPRRSEQPTPANEQHSAVRFFVKMALNTQHKFRGWICQTNPVILFFFIPAFFLPFSRGKKIVIGATVFWLLTIAALSFFFKPQLELRRMVVPAAFLMAPLGGAGIVYVLRQFAAGLQEPEHYLRRGAQLAGIVLLLGALFLTPVNVGAAYFNRSGHNYRLSTPAISNFVEAIRQHGGPGRTMFLGFVLHDYGATAEIADGGHLAPLARFTGNSLYAFFPTHARWTAVDPIPHEFRKKGTPGIEEFLDLINSTATATYNKDWAKYCLQQPNYTLVYREANVWLFARKVEHPTYFLQGDGEIPFVGDDRVEVIPATAETVIKFRYFPQLRVAPAGLAKIEPFPVFTEETGKGEAQQVSFVKLTVDSKALAEKQKFILGFHQ